ncbi:MAG TPA: spore coat biosynthesis protein F, partial [Leptospiraceae bacterium]|nr:spore coat biosynthesis protein F [Leptospiraceae bacterium]
MHEFFAFIQARSTSTRFPKKVLKTIPPESNDTILNHIIQRLKKVIPSENIVFLVPKGDVEVIDYAQKNSIQYFEGS